MGDIDYKNKHKDLGLCVDCSEPVYRDFVRCLKHLRRNNRASKKYRRENIEQVRQYNNAKKIRYKKQRRCTMCSAPLDIDADKNFKCCQNCREHLKIARYENANLVF